MADAKPSQRATRKKEVVEQVPQEQADGTIKTIGTADPVQHKYYKSTEAPREPVVTKIGETVKVSH